MMEIGGCFSQILLLTSIKYIFAKYSQQPGPSTLFTANGMETPQVGLTRQKQRQMKKPKTKAHKMILMIDGSIILSLE